MKAKKLFAVLLSGAVAASQLSALAAENIYTNDSSSSQSLQSDTKQPVYQGTNIGRQTYSFRNWSSPVTSYLTALSDGSLMRFQSNASKDGYLVQYYDTTYNLSDTKIIPKELPLFGAFLSDGKNYYILSGQKNLDESDETEVYRVTKYDTDWNRIGSAGIYGANTYVPFDAGSARMVKKGNLLFIKTCREMYKYSDGFNHQSNITMSVNTEDISSEGSSANITSIPVGSASHSFNQFILTDGDQLVSLDHGDAYPRSLVLCKYNNTIENDTFISGASKSVNMQNIRGKIGDNNTYLSLGGFAMSSSDYLAAYESIDQNSSESSPHNIYISSVPRDLSSEPSVTAITDYTLDTKPASTPQLVQISEDRFLILWTKDGKINYTELDGHGQPSGQIYSMDGNLSDCAPIISNGQIIWYTWKDASVILYGIDTSDISKTSCITLSSDDTTRQPSDNQTSTNPPSYNQPSYDFSFGDFFDDEDELPDDNTSIDNQPKDDDNSVSYEPIDDDASTDDKTIDNDTSVDDPSVDAPSDDDEPSVDDIIINKPKISKISSFSRGFTVKWNRVSGISGYQIRYSSDKRFKNAKTVTVSKPSSASKKIKNLKRNKKYYVNVRAYKTINGIKNYSDWSAQKSVTTKK